jgi:hypothetical protein
MRPERRWAGSWPSSWPGTASGSTWKLGGLTVRPGVLDGHDGLWWWTRARELARMNQPGTGQSETDAASTNSAKTNSWSAWYAYEAARRLLVPVDFLSSPNLEKLDAEQAQIRNSPHDAFPLTLADGPRTWKIDAMRLDPTLLHADLGVVYESTGVTDPAAQRTEAVAVLSAAEGPARAAGELSRPVGLRHEERQANPGHRAADGADSVNSGQGSGGRGQGKAADGAPHSCLTVSG